MKLTLENWLFIIVFQVLFGAAVFALTRAYYEDQIAQARAAASVSSAPVRQLSELPQFSPDPPAEPVGNDPDALRSTADSLFAQKRYEQAARYYARLLELDPATAENYNNLGLTQYYLGNPVKALATLREGTGRQGDYQRIWLTLGFVASGAGDGATARRALEKAIAIDPASPIGEEAKRMLARLP